MGKANRLHKVKRLNGLSVVVQSAVVRWTLTLTWTVIAATLMLSQGSEGSTVAKTSALFGNTETSDAIGHVIINAILAFLWCWTISLYAATQKTTRLILIGGIVWCFVGELTQFFVPERGTSLLDLGANILGVVIGLIAYQVLSAR